MKTALVTLSEAGMRLLAPLTVLLPGSRLYIHESVRRESAQGAWDQGPPDVVEVFGKITELMRQIFHVCREIVCAAPCGVVVRALAPLIQNRLEDPAVVVLDVGGRWAVSLLSGHEGGANDLAIRVGNLLGAEPVVTTTTEAMKDVIVGIGCRRGTREEQIVDAIGAALAEAGVAWQEVRLIASAGVKANEPGLIAAAATLGIPIRFVSATEIRASTREFSNSDFVLEKVNLPAVAEPAALLAGKRTSFICRRKTFQGITVALAREGCFARPESTHEGTGAMKYGPTNHR